MFMVGSIMQCMKDCINCLINFATVSLFLDDKVPLLSLSRGGLWQEHGYFLTVSKWQSNVSELTLDDKVYDPAS